MATQRRDRRLFVVRPALAALLALTPQQGRAATGLQLLQLETVDYAAMASALGNPDRPSIAVRNDGLVRIAISDFEGPCCPLIVPLKVATRVGGGSWTHLTVVNRGDHPVAHFLPGGDLGILYIGFGVPFNPTLRFARVDATSAVIEPVQSLGVNPGAYMRFAPWALEGSGDIQAVARFDLRLRHTTGGWTSGPLSGAPQDVAVGPVGEVSILTGDGLWAFAGSGLSDPGVLTPVAGGVPGGGNLVIDALGRPHIAYESGGTVLYGRLNAGAWSFETVATSVTELLNDQSLVLDLSGRPHVIYRNSAGRIVVASKTGLGWTEEIDLGPGVHGNMVLDASGLIHATFTAASDNRVRYARIEAPTVVAVAVDIKPGSERNPVNPGSRGVIPVAVLTTDDFDAATLSVTTLRFGKNGSEASPAHSSLEDVDGDGDLDLVLHFRTQQTGIGCGDLSASLTGETLGGQAVQGSDGIVTVGCR